MKTRLFVAILAIAMLTMIAYPVYAWNYGNPATPADDNVEYFGPRADKLLIALYASQTSEWDTGLTLGKIDVSDWPLDDTHYTQYTTPPYNNSIMVTAYGPEFGMRLFDLNQNNNTYLGNPPNPTYPQPTDVYFAGGYGNPMAELSLRTAVAYLSDRTKYVQNCGTVTNIAVYTLVGANDLGTSPWGKYTDWDITAGGSRKDLCYLYNVTAASAVLNASGNFPLLPGHTWRSYTPDPAHLAPMDFQLIFYVRTDDTCREYAGDQLTAQLEQSGIQINVKEIGCDITGAHDNVMGAKDFHLYTGGWSLDAVPDYLILWDWAYYWHPGRPYDYAGCNDPTVNVAAESCYSANTQADAVYWSIQFQVAFATGVLGVPLWIAAGYKADYRTYTGGTAGVAQTPDDGENQYRGKYWTGFVNIAGFGTDNYFSFLNLHPEGYDWGNGNMTIRYGFKTAHLQELNPIYTEFLWDNTVIDTVGYDSLVTRNPLNLGQFDPWTCLTFTVTTYEHPVFGTCTKVIYTLRDNVFFQDGAPVTAADLNFTFVEMKQILAVRGLANMWWISNVQDILSLTILDPYNIEVLYDAKSIFAVGWAGGTRILPEHIWYPIVSKGDPTVAAPDPNLIGLGAWRLAEYVSGSHVLLLANTPGSVVQATGDPQLAGSRPVNSTEGFFRLLPVSVDTQVTTPDLAYMRRLAGTENSVNLTIETYVYNWFADRAVGVYSTVDLDYVVIYNSTYTVPKGGDYGVPYKTRTLDLDGNFCLNRATDGIYNLMGVSYWIYNGTNLEYYKWMNVWATPKNANITWNGTVIGSISPNMSHTISFTAQFTIPTTPPLLKFPWPQNTKFLYDIEWYEPTNPYDIAGGNWYEDVAKIVDPATGKTLDQQLPMDTTFTLNTYPYKGDSPTPDQAVNLKDVYACALAFGTSPGDAKWNSLADVNHDYVVNLKDYYAICLQFGWSP
jgi:hypothetical protein